MPAISLHELPLELPRFEKCGFPCDLGSFL
jgi:hypothetical protein